MNQIYSLLGLCKKAGKIAAGETAAVEAIRRKKAYLVLVAEDASENTKKKFQNSAVYYSVPFVIYGEKMDLGRAVGEELRAVLVVTEEGFAKKLAVLTAQTKTETDE